MKRLILMCGIATFTLMSVDAQEKNYRDEYLYETVEIEVGDTLKAKQEAAEQSRIEKKQNIQANAFRLEIVNIIDSLMNNKIKKIKDGKSQQVVRDAFEYNKWLHVSREEEDAAMKGKLDVRAYKMLTDYKKYQQEEYAKYTKEVEPSWKDYLTFHKVTRTIKKKNPHYREGYSDVDAEWQWLEDLSPYNFESRLKHIVTSFPKEENYYTSEQHPDYKLYDIEWKQWYACDRNGKLIGVGYYDGYVQNKGIIQAAMLYDYEQNAYNIKGENQTVYRWSRYLIECGNYDMDADGHIEELTIAMNSLGKTLELGYRTKQVSQTDYNRLMAQIRPAKANLKKKIEDLKKIKPSRADQDRARKYVKQLQSDNEDKYGYGRFRHERQNGTQFLLTNEDRSFQVLLNYIVNEKNELKDEYKVLEKE